VQEKNIYTANSNLLKVAVIGLNHGKRHAESILKMDGCDLVATCTRTDLMSHNRFKGVKNYIDYEELISSEDIDALVVSSPHKITLNIFKAACEKIKYVFLEKPVASTVEEIEEIKRLANKYGVVVLVGHHRRFSSSIIKLKEIIDSNVLGTVVTFNSLWCLKKHTGYYELKDSNWKIDPENGGGPLNINGIHEVDTLRYIFGEIKDIRAFTNYEARKNDVEDTSAIILRFESGVIGTLLISDATPSPFSYEKTINENLAFPITDVSYLQVFGTKSSLSFPECIVYSTSEHESWFDHVSETKLEKFKDVDPLYEEMKHFIHLIRTGCKPKVIIDDAIANLNTIQRIKSEI